VSEARTPCINPRCRRTFKQEHEGQTVVCRKCWNLLPQAVRNRYKQLRRRMRLIERMDAKGVGYRRLGRKYGQPGKGAPQAYMMRLKFDRAWERLWTGINAFYSAPERPLGLETFLQEAGLA
jgi:hypothetical protein